MKVSEERLVLERELRALLVDYWHDVDTNWGRNAAEYYTPDGVFAGPDATYHGREKIRAFYKWREDRGARTVVHTIQNFRAFPDGEDGAVSNWFLILYGADGRPVLPTHAPIQIAYMVDRMVRANDGGWLVSHRKFETWFEGGTPTTNPRLD